MTSPTTPTTATTARPQLTNRPMTTITSRPLSTELLFIPGETEEDGKLRRAYVFIGDTRLVEFNQAVDGWYLFVSKVKIVLEMCIELAMNPPRRPLYDRRIPLTDEYPPPSPHSPHPHHHPPSTHTPYPVHAPSHPKEISINTNTTFPPAPSSILNSPTVPPVPHPVSRCVASFYCY